MTMLRNGLAWVLHSPLRLLSTTAAAAGVLILLVSLTASTSLSHHQSTPSESPQTATTARRGTPSAHSEAALGARWGLGKAQSIAVLDRFLDLYLQDQSSDIDRIPSTLQSITTEALWRGLRVTDVTDLPARPVVDVRVSQAGEFVEDYLVTLQDGATLSVETVQDGAGWRVADVRLESER